jgi:hypothetical protein
LTVDTLHSLRVKAFLMKLKICKVIIDWRKMHEKRRFGALDRLEGLDT